MDLLSGRTASTTPTPTNEKVTVKATKGTVHARLDDAATRATADAPDSAGTVSFQETSAGSSTRTGRATRRRRRSRSSARPPTQCGNSLASTSTTSSGAAASPVLAEPLLERHDVDDAPAARRTTSRARRGTSARRTSPCPRSRPPSRRRRCAREITQAGALGDPYGSGVRTVWWVYGVGPVKIDFEHAGGAARRSRRRCSRRTNQTPLPPPADADYFPLDKGSTSTLPLDEHEAHEEACGAGLHVDAGREQHRARVTVKSVSGPIKVAGAYGFTTRRGRRHEPLGRRRSRRRSRKFPALGPSALPKNRAAPFLHAVRPDGLRLQPCHPRRTPTSGTSWSAKRAEPRLSTIFGVTGNADDRRRADGEGARRERSRRSSSARR